MKNKSRPVPDAVALLRLCQERHRSFICAGQVVVLEAAMASLKWSINYLARASGVSRQMLKSILALEKFPTADRLPRLAMALGMKLHELDEAALKVCEQYRLL